LAEQHDRERAIRQDVLLEILQSAGEEKPDDYSVESDTKTNLEEEALKRSELRTEILELIKTDLTNAVWSRVRLKWWLCAFTVVWMVFVAVILLFNYEKFRLQEGVLIALISGSAAQMLRMFGVVVAHVFPRKGATISADLLLALDPQSAGRD